MLGVDIISIARMERFIKHFGERGLRRFLHVSEIALCEREKPNSAQKQWNYNRIAGFWAAKEAMSKALRCGIGKKLSFLDMDIFYNCGTPSMSVSNTYFDIGKEACALSISHDGGFAIACVMIKQDRVFIK